VTRTQIAIRLEVLAKMINDGDETSAEIEEARQAIAQLGNFPEYSVADEPGNEHGAYTTLEADELKEALERVGLPVLGESGLERERR
jgi:hypothetical protein